MGLGEEGGLGEAAGGPLVKRGLGSAGEHFGGEDEARVGGGEAGDGGELAGVVGGAVVLFAEEGDRGWGAGCGWGARVQAVGRRSVARRRWRA